MPTWGELSEAERQQAAHDYYVTTAKDAGYVQRRYNISNMATALRKLRNRRPAASDALPQAAGLVPAMPALPTTGDVLTTFIAYQQALQAWRDERVSTEIDLTIDDDKPIGLALPADRHIGDIGTDHETQLAHVDILAGAPGVYVVEGGDGVTNYVNPKVADASKPDLPPDAQYAIYRDILRKLHPLCICHGNHDGWTSKFAGVDVLADVAADVRTICAAEGATIRLHVGSQTYTMYRQHRGRYNSAFNLTHAVKRLWEQGPCDFDIGVVDHNHVPACEPFYRHGKLKLAIRPGTYKTMDAWALSQGFHGARIGVPVVFLWPGTWRMQLWPELDDLAGAAEYLAYLRR